MRNTGERGKKKDVRARENQIISCEIVSSSNFRAIPMKSC